MSDEGYDKGYYDATKGTLVMDIEHAAHDADYLEGWQHGKQDGRAIARGQVYEGPRTAAADNPFDGGGSNPFSADGGSDTSGTSPTSAPATSDPQMSGSDSAYGQEGAGASAPADQRSNTAGLKSLAYLVTCLACNQTGTLSRVAKTTRCQCGSDDLAYLRVRKQAEFPPKKKEDEKKEAPAAPGTPPAAPAAPADPAAPAPAAPEAAAEEAATTGGDPGSLKGEDEPGPVVPMIDPATGQPVPVQAPPSEGTGPLPGADPAADPAAAAAAPGAAPAPGAGTDPMDVAQQTLDNVVEQAKSLGHDAMETAYDVDKLFSEWRCQNCGQEGRADLSEDGQVAFSGDLLDGPLGCTMPQGDPAAAPVPGQDPAAPPAPGAAPAAPADAQAPPAAPADPAAPAPAPAAPPAAPAAPGTPAPAPAAPAAPAEEDDKKKPPVPPKKSVWRSWRRVKADKDLNNFSNEQNDANPGDAVPNQEEKLTQIVESILATNPGMNHVVAYQVAEATLERFPSVYKSASDYQSQSARDAEESGYGTKSYWDYLEETALDYHKRGIEPDALTRSLSDSLRGNDGI